MGSGAGLSGQDPVRLRLLLGRAQGLTAAHLHAAAGELEHAVALLASAADRGRAGVKLPRTAAAWLQQPDPGRIEADHAWLQQSAVELLDCFDARYPPLLAAIGDAPALLYVRGDIRTLSTSQLAVVGSRLPSVTGLRNAAQFAAAAAQAGLTVTSGLAQGIDAAAHRGTLEAGGRTVAVLGSGLDVLYPPEHRKLADRIAARGALVTEFPPGTAPRRENFPRRNRLISGLSLGTLVVEAAHRSGSLVTARLAADQGREVFAIPGSIHNPLAQGCHQLLREGATLVESLNDILLELDITFKKQSDRSVPKASGTALAAGEPLDKDYEILLDALGFEPTGINTLVERTGIPSQTVACMLLILEFSGRVGTHAGGRYMRL